MTCAKCSYEFCWLCMGDYQHRELNCCPLRFGLIKTMWIMLILWLFIKLSFNFEGVRTFEMNLVYYLGAILVGDVFLGAFVL